MRSTVTHEGEKFLCARDPSATGNVQNGNQRRPDRACAIYRNGGPPTVGTSEFTRRPTSARIIRVVRVLRGDLGSPPNSPDVLHARITFYFHAATKSKNKKNSSEYLKMKKCEIKQAGIAVCGVTENSGHASGAFGGFNRRRLRASSVVRAR